MRYSHFAAATLTAFALPTLAVADNHGNAEDQALMIVTSDAVQTQSMAMILGNAMREQGTDLHVLLCDAAGNLAVDGYFSAEAINTPPGHSMEQVKPEGLLQMLMGKGVTVDVCAIYLPNAEYGEDELLEGVGVAAPGTMAEMMRDPSISVYDF
ncbi:DsrE family protein [Halomonas sediminis]